MAAIRCSAVRQGDYYIVNGTKKWITGGCTADFFTVAVKTAPDAGAMGISLLLMTKDMPGMRAYVYMHRYAYVLCVCII